MYTIVHEITIQESFHKEEIVRNVTFTEASECINQTITYAKSML
jgi:hypothetical protein